MLTLFALYVYFVRSKISLMIIKVKSKQQSLRVGRS